MKQYIILALAILIIILLNIWQVTYLKNTSRYLLSDLSEIENCIKREDYESASLAITELENTWSIIKPGWDIFGEHDDIENINEHIASMKVYVKYENSEELDNENITLVNLIEHVIDSEKLNLSNVL